MIPVTYEASTSGCPSATLVNTESEFGIEGLVGAANKSGCTREHQGDRLQHRTRFGIGGERSWLRARCRSPSRTTPRHPTSKPSSAGPKPYALIPVAASADVLGFAANICRGFPPNNHALYPQTTFELTPNMVAGMATTALQRGRRRGPARRCQMHEPRHTATEEDRPLSRGRGVERHPELSA